MKLLAFGLLILVLQTPTTNQARQPAPSGVPSQGSSSQTVRVTELPPISTSKDWSDWSYWLFTLFLALIGGLQLYLMWGNLRVVERQAVTMERQTIVLEKSVELAEKSAETAKQNLEM